MNRIILILFILSISIYSSNNLVLGEFPLKGDVDHAVVDGDTIKVEGLDASIRILSIDTEETYKHGTAAVRTKEISDNWDEYLEGWMYKVVDKPVKFNTPLGYQATLWARDFFRGSSIVKLEYDSTESKKGYFGRYLTYVFAKKGDKWVNFNIEIVKHGYSPYSTKYGRSRRFHKEFVEAQKFAQKSKLGVWSKSGKHYPDYDVRMKWWDKRGEQIDHYRKNNKGKILFIGGNDYDYYKLKNFINKKITIFGLITGIEEDTEEYTYKVPFKQFVDATVHVSKKAGISLQKLKKNKDYYAYMTGTVKQDHNNKYHIYITKQKELKFFDDK
jgi:endonuclease YncB( thermonuclease family)